MWITTQNQSARTLVLEAAPENIQVTAIVQRSWKPYKVGRQTRIFLSYQGGFRDRVMPVPFSVGHVRPHHEGAVKAPKSL